MPAGLLQWAGRGPEPQRHGPAARGGPADDQCPAGRLGDAAGDVQDGAEASEDDLIKHCRASLAGYETPKSVMFAADLPETVGGKVLKYKRRSSTSCASSMPATTATSTRKTEPF